MKRPLWGMVGFWGCVAIAIAAVVRRLVALRHPVLGLDAEFASHAALTLAHIVPAALFVIVAACVLVWRVRGRWVEGLFFGLGAITGVTAYAMSRYPVGGWVELSAVLVFNTWFLFSLGRAFWSAGARRHEWMTRAAGILLGIATTRPVMGVFFATSAKTHLAPEQFFGIAFWIGFTINAVLVEIWLRSRRVVVQKIV